MNTIDEFQSKMVGLMSKRERNKAQSLLCFAHAHTIRSAKLCSDFTAFQSGIGTEPVKNLFCDDIAFLLADIAFMANELGLTLSECIQDDKLPEKYKTHRA